MSKGFSDGKAKVIINEDEVANLLKSYKKVKKYMKSSIHTIRKIDGQSDIVSDLINEYNQNPMD